MIGFTAQAARQVRNLRSHYEHKGFTGALRNLDAALDEAATLIEADPGAGSPMPRPYPVPKLAKPGQAWVQVGRYWVRYTVTPPLTVTGWFYDQADIPRRSR